MVSLINHTVCICLSPSSVDISCFRLTRSRFGVAYDDKFRKGALAPRDSDIPHHRGRPAPLSHANMGSRGSRYVGHREKRGFARDLARSEDSEWACKISYLLLPARESMTTLNGFISAI